LKKISPAYVGAGDGSLKGGGYREKARERRGRGGKREAEGGQRKKPHDW